MLFEEQGKKRRAKRVDWEIAKEISSSLAGIHAPMAEWRGIAARLKILATRGCRPADLDEARELLDQVRNTKLAIEALGSTMSLRAVDDSRYIDKLRSLMQLESELEAIVRIMLKGGAFQKAV